VFARLCRPRYHPATTRDTGTDNDDDDGSGDATTLHLDSTDDAGAHDYVDVDIDHSTPRFDSA